jgi:folate-binding protein YgfZ
VEDWSQFLDALGARVVDGQVASFGEGPADYPALLGTDILCALHDLGILEVTGAQSRNFLQGQTTADFATADAGVLRGACCNPQGRVFTLFTAVASAQGYLLVMPRALVESSRTTLGRYAALSRVGLEDASAAYRVLGLAGPDREATLAAAGLGADGGPAADGTLTFAHDADRHLVLVPAAAAPGRWRELAVRARPVGAPLWHLADIRAGIVNLAPETREQFLPQMLDLHRHGAVSFTKGCYTGQEVVARSQYRGKLKRHLRRLAIASAGPPRPGTEIRSPDSPQAAGTVLEAVATGADRCEALAVLQAGAEANPALDFGAGPQPVEVLPLPTAAASE